MDIDKRISVRAKHFYFHCIRIVRNIHGSASMVTKIWATALSCLWLLIIQWLPLAAGKLDSWDCLLRSQLYIFLSIWFNQSNSGGQAIWMDENMRYGKTDSCTTFNNPPLCKSGDFEIRVLEVYVQFALFSFICHQKLYSNLKCPFNSTDMDLLALKVN